MDHSINELTRECMAVGEKEGADGKQYGWDEQAGGGESLIQPRKGRLTGPYNRGGVRSH